jgi:hypothetical protein
METGAQPRPQTRQRHRPSDKWEMQGFLARRSHRTTYKRDKKPHSRQDGGSDVRIRRPMRARTRGEGCRLRNLRLLRVEAIVAYGREGEVERVEAGLELFRRQEQRLIRRGAIGVDEAGLVSEFRRRRLEKERELPLLEPADGKSDSC